MPKKIEKQTWTTFVNQLMNLTSVSSVLNVGEGFNVGFSLIPNFSIYERALGNQLTYDLTSIYLTADSMQEAISEDLKPFLFELILEFDKLGVNAFAGQKCKFYALQSWFDEIYDRVSQSVEIIINKANAFMEAAESVHKLNWLATYGGIAPNVRKNYQDMLRYLQKGMSSDSE